MHRRPTRPLGASSLLWIVFLELALASISGAGVDSWHDRGWRFSTDATWEWLDVAEPTTLKPPQLSPEDLAIRGAVESALDELGLRRETQADVDLYLAYELVPPRPRRKPRAPSSRPRGADMSLSLPNLGSKRSDNLLYLEIRDAFRNQPVWRGWYQPLAKREVHTEDLQRAVTRILELYPQQ